VSKPPGGPCWSGGSASRSFAHPGITETRRAVEPDGAQALAGHASAKMTEHYSRLTFEDAARVALKIG
jgi:hypothetical protein